MSRYTLQEWVRVGNTVYALNSEKTNRFTAHVQGGWASDGRLKTEEAELEANARLIAAARESHEANLAFVAAANRIWEIKPDRDDEFIYDEMGSDLSAAYFSARAAIAKATGDQP